MLEINHGGGVEGVCVFLPCLCSGVNEGAKKQKLNPYQTEILLVRKLAKSMLVFKPPLGGVFEGNTSSLVLEVQVPAVAQSPFAKFGASTVPVSGSDSPDRDWKTATSCEWDCP